MRHLAAPLLLLLSVVILASCETHLHNTEQLPVGGCCFVSLIDGKKEFSSKSIASCGAHHLTCLEVVGRQSDLDKVLNIVAEIHPELRLKSMLYRHNTITKFLLTPEGPTNHQHDDGSTVDIFTLIARYDTTQ